ncbi:hypothetical protein Daesc_008276 [Daldinia eschscholtzii]|uniref:Uncharacterized protein n=1 Tax=Daldinia eschscholtzii TaxID=292717 RepID=A0AAX6MBV6_9PEZI
MANPAVPQSTYAGLQHSGYQPNPEMTYEQHQKLEAYDQWYRTILSSGQNIPEKDRAVYYAYNAGLMNGYHAGASSGYSVGASRGYDNGARAGYWAAYNQQWQQYQNQQRNQESSCC